ncbi:DUF342 domain-containing protein [Viridibacillus sp. YIM B01967]|uniref:DUF342 domain-containing protein n=1 Tax=Viridibacillus soli TaxID=2798301 RepID=A0ABS1H3R9_9BACL|nr:FapA family protein [Viridibacillus soli]MBK3494064.1 DUF342 domain-containing protein [Viridibacillus soli]
MLIFENDDIFLKEENDIVYLKTLREGFSLKDFDSILKKNPRIKLSSFAILRKVTATVSEQFEEIGKWLPPIEIAISRDRMSATMYVHEDPATVFTDSTKMQEQIKEFANNIGIVHGFVDLTLDTVLSGKPTVVAIGTPAIPGKDAKITYIEKPVKKPVILEDGRADYFDMNFIYEIEAHEWLGEKIPADQGVPGKNIIGESIPALPGRDFPIKYDQKTVYETDKEDGKVTIYATNGGVLDDSEGFISVQKHLPVAADVGVGTGNLKFDGSISIKGTVLSGYSVVATGDIAIECVEGVTSPKLIESLHGDVYIRGGIFGNGESVVRAGGNIFVKHTNESTLNAQGDIHIGSYALGSNLTASSILINEYKGKIIGGRAEATHSITTAIAGNHLERKTELVITMPDRKESMQIVKEKAEEMKVLEADIVNVKARIAQLQGFVDKMNGAQRKAYEDSKVLLSDKENELMILDKEVQVILQSLKSMGTEVIQITKEAYPGTYIQLGKKSTTLNKQTRGRFKLDQGEINA